MPLIFAILGPCALLWFCAPGGGLSLATAQAATQPPAVHWEIRGAETYDGAAALAASGWEPYAVTHTSIYSQPIHYLRRRTK